ncbi:hypothetical protein OA84_10485 [Kaistella solincola]|uniref:Uncharacterized protein n=1 Tax=Kaistella solincola TaxID=510955 RepID=A0ABR4ZQK2_9FLAO|nr:hypothetical protein [Kaistella solincola]KIA82579.1 hypothetical protein OA84_10485 [Kaistella solincola]
MKTLTKERLNIYRIISLIITLVGIALLIFMITVESEPGLLPLLLFFSGISATLYFHLKLKNLAK